MNATLKLVSKILVASIASGIILCALLGGTNEKVSDLDQPQQSATQSTPLAIAPPTNSHINSASRIPTDSYSQNGIQQVVYSDPVEWNSTTIQTDGRPIDNVQSDATKTNVVISPNEIEKSSSGQTESNPGSNVSGTNPGLNVSGTRKRGIGFQPVNTTNAGQEDSANSDSDVPSLPKIVTSIQSGKQETGSQAQLQSQRPEKSSDQSQRTELQSNTTRNQYASHISAKQRDTTDRQNRFPAVTQAPVTSNTNNNPTHRVANRYFAAATSPRGMARSMGTPARVTSTTNNRSMGTPAREKTSTPAQTDSSFVPAKSTNQLTTTTSRNDQSTAPPTPPNRVASRLTNAPIEPAASFVTPNTPVKIQPANAPGFSAPPQPKSASSNAAALTITPQPSPNPTTQPKSKPNQQIPGALQGAESFVLAEQPKFGDHWKNDTPIVDQRAIVSETYADDFSPDAVDLNLPYDPYHQMHVYEGNTLNANQRPIVELGRPWYQLGQLSPGSTILGKHNVVTPQFLIYGDVRSAFASNTQNGDNVTQSASEVNLDFDLKLTGTERIHMFMSPLDNGVTNTGYRFGDDEFVDQFDADIDFGYFEGDLGAIVGGFTDQTLPFDLPFAVGVMPLLIQNGIWMEDAFLGVAATIPARNSARFNISNMDTTFFAGYDKISSPAFPGDDSAARMVGMASFIEALNGYFEVDYAFLDDRTFDNRSYHNLAFAYTRRYGRLISNSTRMIVNTGQETDVVSNTADGVLLLSENSLITGAPSTVVPYFNFFAGFDRPQSAARAAQAGGILRNTGILFESDGMTGYPTLDATANDAFGGALGLNLLASDFSQQLVVEAAFLNVIGDNINRNAAGNQYGLGLRYQLPLTNAIIFRADGMVGFLDDDHDIHGVRMELRHKY